MITATTHNITVTDTTTICVDVGPPLLLDLSGKINGVLDIVLGGAGVVGGRGTTEVKNNFIIYGGRGATYILE